VNPFELRKVIIVGCRFDAPDGAPMLDRDGLPLKMQQCPMHFQVAFWVPAKRGAYVRTDGATKVVDARPFEVAALRDGAIVEQVIEVTFDRQPTQAELRHCLVPIWEELTVQRGGYINGVPLDNDPKPLLTLG
jgi:hypothetical protein